MEYKGKLYGHLGGKMYFDTGKTADDWDALEKRVAELEAENQALRQPPVIKSVCGDCIFYLTCKHESRDKQICVHFDDPP